MTKEQVKTTLQEVLAKTLEAKGMDPDILVNGVPPKNDPDQLSLGNDLRLTTKADFGTLAKDISDAFSIAFPWDEAQAAATLDDLVTAVFKEVSASVGAAAGLAMAAHMGPMTCPKCGHVMGTGKKKPQRGLSAKKKPGNN